MSIFEFEDYKEFVRARIGQMPKGGHGEYQKISKALRMHTTRVSHIFRGHMHLTIEQAASLCKYFGMGQVESEYFLVIVQIARAGSNEAKQILLGQAKSLRIKSKALVNRVPKDRSLTEIDKSIFYSSWIYSATRLLCSIEGFQTVDSISEKLRMPRSKIREVLDFLVEAGLSIQENGTYKMGSQTTHLESSSPHVQRHHASWRIKALQKHDRLTQNEMAYTCPVSLSRKDQESLRELLVSTIQLFLKTVVASEPPELVACLNIDWFELN